MQDSLAGNKWLEETMYDKQHVEAKKHPLLHFRLAMYITRLLFCSIAVCIFFILIFRYCCVALISDRKGCLHYSSRTRQHGVVILLDKHFKLSPRFGKHGVVH